ncbi:MAG: carbamoyltransferase [Gammaproteobacteria bacterium]|nr:carbamoyltransferase [Gammaproteobacteria bacterium]
MIILGLSGALGHDPSAALLVDGEIVAAAEEERFVRDKHAKKRMPIESARYCLSAGGIDPADVDIVAFPYAPIPLSSPARWRFARGYWYAPDRALDALLNGNRRFRRNRRRVHEAGVALGIDWSTTEFVPVEHHLAHASSAYHLSGFEEKTAILGVDGKGEYATTFFGYGENGRIHRLKEFYDPDSLSGVYGAMTEYLGFEMLDGEYKVMGMAPYGDADRFDLSRLIRCNGTGFRVNTRYVNTVGLRRYKEDRVGFYFSPKLIEWLGPRRQGDAVDEPYVHHAAAMQQLFEGHCLDLMETWLGDILRETGRLAFAGGGALNVKLNQRIVALPHVRELFVQPASGDAGTSLGAATHVAAERGERLHRMTHVFLGPEFSHADCLAALDRESHRADTRRLENVPREVAEILAAGHPVAWFQGRMEFGPRALGARSILGCPSVPGIADRINEQIKFRERWRPFCPSVLDRVAPEIVGTDHPAPFMTITFDVTPGWRERIPEVVHEDGTARIQVVERATNPRYYALLEDMERLTGNGVLLNTSLNRRGEPIVCPPADALDMFFGSDLQYLALEDFLVTKRNDGG